MWIRSDRFVIYPGSSAFFDAFSSPHTSSHSDSDAHRHPHGDAGSQSARDPGDARP
jgi:hypothetical protein